MGVPGFFAWLLRNYKKNGIITPSIDVPVDILYLDANCLIHPQCYKVLDYYNDWKSQSRLEAKMMTRVINYIDFLLDKIDPKVKLFIAVDGVAPMAKMNQQRKRRFRSIEDNILRNNIKQKHGREVGRSWSNTAITPGTEFMEKLHRRILKYIETRNDIRIYYSSYHTPGEGEHKILQDIKQQKGSKTYVIYGLDADLIFLSMASQKKNIYLLRESNQLRGGKGEEHGDLLAPDILEDVAEELDFVSMDEMRRCMNAKMAELIDTIQYQRTGINFSDDLNLSNDFIFICYFLGNDFLPHLPSVDIKTRGLDFLIDCYINVYLMFRTPIINLERGKVRINSIFIERFLEQIARSETYYFRNVLPRHHERLENRRCPTSDACERELWELDHMRNMIIDDPIRLGDGSTEHWKSRYYDHYFHITEYQQEHIDDMAKEFMHGLVWTTKYYFEECPSYEWQYFYSHAPFVSDIHEYFERTKMDLDKVQFEKTKPIPPCMQLLAVLPPSCTEMLPKNYAKLIEHSSLSDLYPKKMKLDMINKDMYYKCVPLIPCVDIARIKEATADLTLTSNEKIRNLVYNTFSNDKAKE